MSFQDSEAPLIPPKRSSGRSNGHASHMANGNSSRDSMKIFQEATKFDFYHGKLESKQVEKILRDHLQTKGSYLLRKSNRHPDALTFSVVHTANHIYHFNVFWKKGKFTVTESLMFPSLEKLIAHFKTHEIPGNGTPGLYLQHPIRCLQASSNSYIPSAGSRSSPITFRRSPKNNSPNNSPHSSPKSNGFFGRLTPPVSPKFFRKNNSVEQPSRLFDSRQNAAPPVLPSVPPPALTSVLPSVPPPDPADRPPMPIPREPIYDSRRHQYDIYSVPDDPDRDRFYDIRALCQRADNEIAKQSRKCTCGLYLHESTLVDNWMMHRDIENPQTKGKIFFVNTATNEATWQLPNQIRRKMETTDPERWKSINALLQSENGRT